MTKICVFANMTEDDTSIATEIKVPILLAFHRHIYEREWHFSCELSTSALDLLGTLYVLI